MILAVLFVIALVAFGIWYGYRSYQRTVAERRAWAERDRQIRRDRGEDV